MKWNAQGSAIFERACMFCLIFGRLLVVEESERISVRLFTRANDGCASMGMWCVSLRTTRPTESQKVRIQLAGIAVGAAHGFHGCRSWRIIWRDGQWAHYRSGRSQEKAEGVEEKGGRGTCTHT